MTQSNLYNYSLILLFHFQLFSERQQNSAVLGVQNAIRHYLDLVVKPLGRT